MTSEHGTASAYRHGCRCQSCRAAWAIYFRGYHMRRGGRAARSFYRGKIAPGVSVTLTRLGRRILNAASARTGRSRSDVVEHLLRQAGGRVVFGE